MVTGDNRGGRNGLRQDHAAAAAGAGPLPGAQAASAHLLHAAQKDICRLRRRTGNSFAIRYFSCFKNLPT